MAGFPVPRNSAFLLLPIVALSGLAEAAVRLRYRPAAGAAWVYATERKDSVRSVAGKDGQVGYRRIEQSVSPLRIESGGSWTARLATDSVWSSGNAWAGRNRFEEHLYRTAVAGDTLTLSETGAAEPPLDRFFPFLLALPEGPVSEDDAWPVEWTGHSATPFEGTVRVSGNAMLYRVDAAGTDTLAVCVVRLDMRTELKTVIREPFQSITHFYTCTESANGVAWFNVKKGLVHKAVFEWQGEATVKTPLTADVYGKASHVTTRWINP